jgi:hypothetical protein
VLLLFWGTDESAGTGTVAQLPATVSATGGQFEPGAVPLQVLPASYLYQQYADDFDLWAFVNAYNAVAQTYLDWFNQTPLAVYTSPAINGPLLDWIMAGIYGLERPVFSSLTTRFVAGLNSGPLNVATVNGSQFFQSGTATPATDDFFKRVGTWILYAGDGPAFTIPALRLKVARFLYGVNGTDVGLDLAQTVHIVVGGLAPPPVPSLSQVAGGSISARTYGARTTYVTPTGETLAGPPAQLAVSSDNVLVVASPPAEIGAEFYNIYMNIATGGPFVAGVNSGAVNGSPVNGTNMAPVNLPTRQNGFPIPIGTAWTEPTTGWVYGPPLPASDTSNAATNLLVVVPPVAAAALFQQAMAQGILPIPVFLSASVVIS